MKTRAASFNSLGPCFWSYRNCIRSDHYLARRKERGFDERWLQLLWESGEWSDAGNGRFAIACRIPGDGVWVLVVDFDSVLEVPEFVTVKFQGDARLAA
jgi:hypothetical protein